MDNRHSRLRADPEGTRSCIGRRTGLWPEPRTHSIQVSRELNDIEVVFVLLCVFVAIVAIGRAE
eukprot:7077353-Prymnesium_polylepis.1